MTESEDDSKSVANPVAARLALELGGYNETPGIEDDFSLALSTQQQALISDTFGLLNGIGFGTITTSQPRIRDNLVEVISELPNENLKDGKVGLVQALSSILARASAAGLTAENQPLSSRTSHRAR